MLFSLVEILVLASNYVNFFDCHLNNFCACWQIKIRNLYPLVKFYWSIQTVPVLLKNFLHKVQFILFCKLLIYMRLKLLICNAFWRIDIRLGVKTFVINGGVLFSSHLKCEKSESFTLNFIFFFLFNQVLDNIFLNMVRFHFSFLQTWV